MRCRISDVENHVHLLSYLAANANLKIITPFISCLKICRLSAKKNLTKLLENDLELRKDILHNEVNSLC